MMKFFGTFSLIFTILLMGINSVPCAAYAQDFQDPDKVQDLTPPQNTVPVAPNNQSEAEDDKVPDLTERLKASLPPEPEPVKDEQREPISPGMVLPINENQINDMIARDQDPETMRSEAFEQSLDGLFPLRPQEIRRVLKKFDETREAAEKPINDLPKPEVAFTTISLDPGAEPLAFKLATGHVTTVTFLDRSGQPWPIQDVSWAGNFEILQPEQGANILRVTPLGEHAFGNVSIRLSKLTTPLTFSLATHRDAVQYRLDIQVPEMGPNARAPLMQGSSGPTSTAGDTTMTAMLEGIIPKDAIKMAVIGTDGRTSAHKYKNMIYLRTPLTLLSPAWNASVKSADGMNVYALASAPVILLSDHGKMVRTTLNEPVADPLAAVSDSAQQGITNVSQ